MEPKTDNITLLKQLTDRLLESEKSKAKVEFDFGKEVDINFSGLIKKLEGIDFVVFVGGLSGHLEGEEMPVSYPGFKGGDRTDIELPAVQRNCLKALKQAGKKVIYVNCSGSAIHVEFRWRAGISRFGKW